MPIVGNPCCCNGQPPHYPCDWLIAPEYATSGEGEGSVLRNAWDDAYDELVAEGNPFLLFHMAEMPNITKWLSFGNPGSIDPPVVASPATVTGLLRELLEMGPKGKVIPMRKADLSYADDGLVSFNIFWREYEWNNGFTIPPPPGIPSVLYLSKRLGTLSYDSPNTASTFHNLRLAYVEGGGGSGFALLSEYGILDDKDGINPPHNYGAAWADPYAPVAGELLVCASDYEDTYQINFSKLLANQWTFPDGDTYPFWQITTQQPFEPGAPFTSPIKFCSKIPFENHIPPVHTEGGDDAPTDPNDVNCFLFNDSLNKTGDDPHDDKRSENFKKLAISFGYQFFIPNYYTLTKCHSSEEKKVTSFDFIADDTVIHTDGFCWTVELDEEEEGDTILGDYEIQPSCDDGLCGSSDTSSSSSSGAPFCIDTNFGFYYLESGEPPVDGMWYLVPGGIGTDCVFVYGVATNSTSETCGFGIHLPWAPVGGPFTNSSCF